MTTTSGVTSPRESAADQFFRTAELDTRMLAMVIAINTAWGWPLAILAGVAVGAIVGAWQGA